MNFFEFQERFPTEFSCILYFIKIRYAHGITCNHCGAEDKVYHRTTRPKNFTCHNCKNDFSIFKGTIFEDSSTSLRKWFLAIRIMSHVGRKGISAKQLHREIGVTYKCAWRMLNRIRIGMGNTDIFKEFECLVEIDETYVGGKPRKENKRDQVDENGELLPVQQNKRGRGTKKTPVVAVVERTSKRVVAKVMHPNKEGKKLTGKQLLNVLEQACQRGTTVITDEFSGYNILDRKDCNGMVRLSIDHSKAYVDGIIHTNNVESFWALLKRGILGIYHHVSVKYLQRYVDEFCFRMNHRTEHAFGVLVRQCVSY